MSHGGKRERAGRKAGSVNKLDQEARKQAADTGELPLDYMLRVMRDKTQDQDRRDRMAQACAPYLHAKLASVEHGGKGGGPITVKIVD